jgi:hypothetical protein
MNHLFFLCTQVVHGRKKQRPKKHYIKSDGKKWFHLILYFFYLNRNYVQAGFSQHTLTFSAIRETPAYQELAISCCQP